MPPRLTGLIAAVHTPMNPDGSLNLDVVEQQAELLAADGVAGVFVGGTTGEAHSLTLAERLDLGRRWGEVGPRHDLSVVIHVGHNCQADARTLAEDAQRHGADAIAALAPNYFKPSDQSALIDFLAPVAAAASDLPFYFYDIPSMTDVQVSMPAFLAEAPRRISNLAGVKFTNTDLVSLQECLRIDDGHFDILFGCDEMLLAAWCLGVRGAVGSTYNFAAPLYLRMIEAFERGDLEAAQAEQFESVRLVRMLSSYGFMAAAKAVMGSLGVECGPVRPPLTPLTDPRTQEVRRAFAALKLRKSESGVLK